MRLTVLGSGTLTPHSTRGPSGHLVQAGGDSLLFDSGAGTLQRLARAGHDWRDVRRVFCTHFHPDHSLDLVSLLFARNHAPDAPEGGSIIIYGPPGLKGFYDKVRSTWPAVEPKRFELELRELEHGDAVKSEGWTVRAGATRHGGTASLGYRVESGRRSLVLSGDTSFCPELVELAVGADLVLAECSTDDHGLVEGHLSPSGVARLLRESGAKAALIVHVYPPHDPESLAAECAGLSGVEVRAARDLDSFEI